MQCQYQHGCIDKWAFTSFSVNINHEYNTVYLCLLDTLFQWGKRQEGASGASVIDAVLSLILSPSGSPRFSHHYLKSLFHPIPLCLQKLSRSFPNVCLATTPGLTFHLRTSPVYFVWTLNFPGLPIRHGRRCFRLD